MSVSRVLRVLGACVLALGLVLVGSGPAFAHPGYGTCKRPVVELSSTVTRGGQIIVTGRCFKPRERVGATLSIRGKFLGVKTADGSGRVKFSFSTRDLKPGQYRVALAGRSGVAVAKFTVIARKGNGGGPGSSDGFREWFRDHYWEWFRERDRD